MMTTPCGHSAPTHSEPLPSALCQPNSSSRHGFVLGTGWPIVTGQCLASAIVTGRAGYLAGALLDDPAADPALVADLVAVVAGPPVQPSKAALIPAARAVAMIGLRAIRALLRFRPITTPLRHGRFPR